MNHPTIEHGVLTKDAGPAVVSDAGISISPESK